MRISIARLTEDTMQPTDAAENLKADVRKALAERAGGARGVLREGDVVAVLNRKSGHVLPP
jgi:hypothetical protein